MYAGFTIFSIISSRSSNGINELLSEFIVTRCRSANFQSNDFLPGTTLFAKKSLLNMAIIHQRRHVVEWLVDKKKVNVNSCGDGEFSPLIYAAYGGNLKLVEYLLSRGADECKLDFLGSWIIRHKYLHRKCSLMLKDGH